MSTDISNYSQIISRGYTIIDKTLLIVEFIESNPVVSIIVRPNLFGKTTNLSMIKDFLSIPNFPDNFNYRHELFRGTKIMDNANIIEEHFCKYPVMHISFKDNENLEKALLVGTFPIAKLGFTNMHAFTISDVEYADKFGFTEEEVSIIAQYYDFENHEEEIKQWYGGYKAGDDIQLYNPFSINSLMNKKVFKKYKVDAGCIVVFTKLLWHLSEDVHKQITELHSKGMIMVSIMDLDYDLLLSRVDEVFWILLYYTGYLTMDLNKNLRVPNKELESVFHDLSLEKHQGFAYSVDSMLDMLLRGDILKFEQDLPKIIMEVLSFHDIDKNQSESGYHLFMIGLLSHVQFYGYKIRSNREEGLGRFDLRIDPESPNVKFETSIIMEFKILRKNKKKTGGVSKLLRDAAEEGLAQISNMKYCSSTPARSTKLVNCGIAFEGKEACVLSRVFNKEDNQWVELSR
ncbi:DUF1703-domain-containing protein [Gigaspora margarita]|uniref:DUF1703-domain-containing protein n=1 Tax=Gigaspora margarita TaxID=4874 RepID=A0A8H4EVQ4_GIGMA|nr:DUF1703-domain-containing protein [Gigaspora margarita]